jgi:transposase
MARAYSQDLRDRVLSAYDRGMPTKEIAEAFEVSRSWARRVKQTRREQGRTTPLPRGGARVVKIDMKRLAELVGKKPDSTLRELQEQLEVECCETTVCRALRRLNLTFKKKRSTRQNRIGRTLPNDDGRGGPGSARGMPAG